jgi:hypothetical protein
MTSTPVKEDQFVTAIFNSTGLAQVAVPNVVDQTQAVATTALTAAGLSVGTVTQQSSSTVASGYVISESPAAGTNIASGSAVNLVVSTGGSNGAGSGGGYGGGGGVDAPTLGTLGALLGSLIVGLRRARRTDKAVGSEYGTGDVAIGTDAVRSFREPPQVNVGPQTHDRTNTSGVKS